MKPIQEAVKELRRVLFSMRLFESLLDSFIVYLGSLLIFSLISLSWYWALIPFLGYGVLHTLNSVKGVSFHDVEHKVPVLHESLRTAADSAQKENIIVNELHSDVIAKLKEVRTSYFLGMGKTTRQLLLLAAFSFGIIIASALNVKLLNAPEIAIDLSKLKPVQKYTTAVQDIVFGPAKEDIYGNESIAELGTKELKLQINPLMSEININDIKPPEDKEFVESFPRDIQASTDTSFDEKIAKEHQQIVKNYFTGIAK